MRRLKFGIQTPPFHDWPTLTEIWRQIERLGWDSIWLPDHFLPTFRRELPWFESWTLLSALAMSTSRVRIGVLVTCNTFRPPALLAKMAITVDHISGGRLEFGLGTGWVEFEHTMFGIDYPDSGERVARFGEALIVVDTLMRNEVSSWQGDHYRLEEALFRPAPLQVPRVPFTLAAHGPKMLALIAPYVDRWNSMGTVAEMAERGARLDEAVFAVGRVSETVIKSLLYVPSILPDEHPWDSVEAFADFVGRYREVGVTDFIFQPPAGDRAEMLEHVAESVLPALR